MRTLAVSGLILGLLSGAGCRSWAIQGEHQVKIIAPAKVSKGDSFAFRVEVRDRGGNPVEGARFWWTIDWVGLQGSEHKNKSFEELSIRAKGSPGTATLRVQGYDASNDIVEMARHDFTVE